MRLILSYVGKSEALITFISDRRGYDLRYVIDNGEKMRALE